MIDAERAAAARAVELTDNTINTARRVAMTPLPK
jgi:hypothetical protein